MGGFAASGAEFIAVIQALQQMGVTSKVFQNISNVTELISALNEAGYFTAVAETATGTEITVGALGSVTVPATTTATTGLTTTATELCGVEIIDTTATVVDLGIATEAGGTATTAGLGFLPEAAVAVAIAAALGIAVDSARDIASDEFDWAEDSIAGHVLTFISGDGKTYINERVIESIKNQMLNKGYFDNSISHGSISSQDYIEVSHFSLYQAGFRACNNLKYSDYSAWEADGFTQEKFNSIKEGLIADVLSEINNYIVGNYEGLGVVSVGINRVYTFGYNYANTYTIQASKVSEAKGTYDLENGGSVVIKPSAYYYINHSPFGYPVYERKEESGSISVTSDGIDSTSVINIGELNPNAKPLQPGATTPSEVPFPQTYPEWSPSYIPSSNPITNPLERPKIYPLSVPEVDPSPQPSPQPDPQPDPEPQYKPKTQPETQTGINTVQDLDIAIKPISGVYPQLYPEGNPDSIPDPDKVPEEDIGTTPVIATPTNETDTGMVSIYNPTKAQLSEFSKWLWSSNFVDNIVKIFQDPMQAVIGLHMIYATPSRGTDSNIVIGSLDSGKVSRTVSNTIISIDCGNCKVNKYYGNVLDYINTKIECYLPFIGIVELDTADVMNKTINIKYKIDVLTGTCIARILVNDQMLYTYNGNCAIQLPLSSANYTGMITGLIGLAGSSLATYVSGGALAPTLIGAVGNLPSNLGHTVERSGNIGSNAGALNNKKPYLIISRNLKYEAADYNKYYGYPVMENLQLKKGIGYTRVHSIIENGISATQEELNELEDLLKKGVIL